MTTNWTIPQISGQPLEITLEATDRLFIVGANGSGKSALIQYLISSNQGKKIRRISAHRQTWFQSGSIDLTPQSRRQFDQQDRQHEAQNEARWRDYNAQMKQSAVLFDLVAKENTRARRIARYVDDQNTEEAKKVAAESVSPLVQLNELLLLGTLEVTLENSNDEEILARRPGIDTPYSIAQMSDGERNAIIIAATVLTVEPETMLVIDEPERHLHRSIIEPFLSALFESRRDCAFVVSTHEIALPVANPEARVLMVRSCQWGGGNASAWDIQVLQENADLPEELKQAIIGSRRRILFVEGESGSLDLPLYNALFLGISVVPKGGCIAVQKAVSGLRGSLDLHHVQAFGLIDRDDRTEDEIDRLAKENIFALDVYSAEALYYCSDAIAAVAHRQAESLGRSVDEMIKSAKREALKALEHDELAERMAARRCERRVRNQMLSHAPGWKSIKTNATPKIHVCVDSPFSDELARFKKLVIDEKLDDLVARYPLRDSRVFSTIAQALECRDKRNYEQTLLARIGDDPELEKRLRQRIGPLSHAL